MHMISQIAAVRQRQDWQNVLANAITNPAELLQVLGLDASLLMPMQQAAKQFSLRIPRAFVARMQKGNPYDPLLRQVLPLGEELQQHPEYSVDPLQEHTVNPIPGLLHKYKGRVLLTVAGACAINCRYCFRRHFPYAENNPGRVGWEKVISYIQADASIKEVIFSGGDPLLATDISLRDLIEKIAAITHVNTLRIHTRMPVVIPERITPELIKILSDTRLRSVMVLHCNHAQEIDNTVFAAMDKLQDAKITLLNQTVLLKGINDDAAILAGLSEILFACGILPYYLHLLDKVTGSAHFAVSEIIAKKIYAELLELLPGYLVPRLVKEVPGAYSKCPVV